jgi:hypothetical protein
MQYPAAAFPNTNTYKYVYSYRTITRLFVYWPDGKCFFSHEGGFQLSYYCQSKFPQQQTEGNSATSKDQDLVLIKKRICDTYRMIKKRSQTGLHEVNRIS